MKSAISIKFKQLKKWLQFFYIIFFPKLALFLGLPLVKTQLLVIGTHLTIA